MSTSPTPWQQALSHAFNDIESLCQYLKLDPAQLPILAEYRQFPIKVTREFAARMQPGNPNDPLLRQVLPLQQELEQYPGFVADPVGDLQALATEGVIQKYQGRVLLISTSACAIHCRYCFRRNFPYAEQQLSTRKLQQALNWLEQHAEISEVILSGGDPLLLNDTRWTQLLEALNGMPHIQRIRIHSRIPIVLPARITPELLQQFAHSRAKLVMVMHSNHANELNADVANACRQLRNIGITVLNQSVLLRTINDDADSLCELSERLFSLGVLPYYLHQLDHAQGTGHFAVSDSHALQLIHSLRVRLPGYLVPKLVREQAGAAYKLNLG